MKRIDAFSCDYTGAIFRDEKDAARHEFKALMRVAGSYLPALGSVSISSIMEHLASNLASPAYPRALPALTDALRYLREHHDLIVAP